MRIQFAHHYAVWLNNKSSMKKKENMMCWLVLSITCAYPTSTLDMDYEITPSGNPKKDQPTWDAWQFHNQQQNWN